MTVPLSPREGERLLTGWGRTAPSAARVVPVGSADDVAAAVQAAAADPAGRGVLARGLGRSYGDAAQDGGGTVLDLAGLSSVRVDTAAGTLTAGAGASLDDILRHIVPLGFFVPVTPGHGS